MLEDQGDQLSFRPSGSSAGWHARQSVRSTADNLASQRCHAPDALHAKGALLQVGRGGRVEGSKPWRVEGSKVPASFFICFFLQCLPHLLVWSATFEWRFLPSFSTQAVGVSVWHWICRYLLIGNGINFISFDFHHYPFCIAGNSHNGRHSGSQYYGAPHCGNQQETGLPGWNV